MICTLPLIDRRGPFEHLPQKSLNILQITSGRNINGALTYCKFLSEHLIANGHSITILCRKDGWIEHQDIPGAKFFHSEMDRTPAEIQRVSDWMQQQRFDVIHTHMSRAHSFGVLLKIKNGVPVIATAHNRSFQLHWKLNDYVIANSNATCRYQKRINLVPSRRIETVHCFTDLQRFHTITELSKRRIRRQLRARQEDLLIGVVGEVVKRKGHLYLFKALAEISKAVPNFKLVLLGRFKREEAYVKRMRRVLLKSNMLGKVKWLGLRSNVEEYMATFDLTVVPSIEEPLGLVALESLAAGTPVVASNTGGLPEIIQHGVSGLIVPSKRPAALAKAVIELANDPQRRMQMGHAGKSFVFESFDPQTLSDKVEGIYERVIGNLPAHRRRAA
jgi:glycosyltransferase involved in cell wall biosynthesis